MFKKPTPEEATQALEVHYPSGLRIHLRVTPQKYEAIMTLIKDEGLQMYQAIDRLAEEMPES